MLPDGGHIDPERLYKSSRYLKGIPNSNCANFSFGFSTTVPHHARCLLTARETLPRIHVLGPGSETGPIICAADLWRFRLRCLRHNLPLVVDCPSNRLNGRLTLQKGFNRALRLSAFMSSSGRQRSYPISPLLPQLAERMHKISLDTSWLIGLEPKALHGLFGQRSDDAIHLAAARPRCLNGQMWCVG
jgi:hypothetical protein